MPTARSRKTRTWGRLTDGTCPASKTYFFYGMWRDHWSHKASECRAREEDEEVTYAESRMEMPPGRVSLVDGLYCEFGGDCLPCCVHSWPKDNRPEAIDNFVGLVAEGMFEAFPVQDQSASFVIETSRQDWKTTKHELLFEAAHQRTNVAILVFWLAMIAGAVACLIPDNPWPATLMFISAPVWMITLLLTGRPPKGPAPAKEEKVSAEAKGFTAG